MIRSMDSWVLCGRIHYTNCTSVLYPVARGHFRSKVQWQSSFNEKDAFLMRRLPHIKSISCRMDPVLLHNSSELPS